MQARTYAGLWVAQLPAVLLHGLLRRGVLDAVRLDLPHTLAVPRACHVCVQEEIAGDLSKGAARDEL